MIRKSVKRNKNNKRNKGKKGGKAIAAGTYGCVFNPPLLCNTDKSKSEDKRDSRMVSKLMLTVDLDEEWKEMKKILPYIKQIPNYQNYFLVENMKKCVPKKIVIESDDSFKYEDKCTNFTETYPTINDINSYIKNFRILNLPNGGEEVADYWKKCTSASSFNELKDSLVDLFENGILPLNERNVYHLDVKNSNILFSDVDKHARLIDWGLTQIITPDILAMDFDNKDDIIYNGFQFNVPVSSILINSKINGWLSGKTGLVEQTMAIVHGSMEENDIGHLETINRNYTDCFPGSNSKDVLVFIYEYIAKVIKNRAYVSTNSDGDTTLDLQLYLQDVYLKNVDIWGFLTVFMDFLYNDETDTRIQNITDIKEKIKGIIRKYLFNKKYATEPILVDELITDLNGVVAEDGN